MTIEASDPKSSMMSSSSTRYATKDVPSRLPRVAYLINQYPQPSQSFIRREIAALEAQGGTVPRFSIRRWEGSLVDPKDILEQKRTKIVLDVGVIGLMLGTLRRAITHPSAAWNALKLAVCLGRRSERGVLLHLIYLAEACVLVKWLNAAAIEHIHTHFGTNSATVALLVHELGGPPYSITVHGPEEFDHPWALGLDEKIQRSAFVVAISEFGRSQLCRWVSHDQWSKLKIVHCGLDAMFLSVKPTPPPLAPRLVCVGRLCEQKGQLVLIEAAAKLHAEGVQFELILAGDGPMRADIEALIDRFRLHDQVKLAGWQSSESVRDLIQGSRAMVLPSFAEGLPVVIMEALALGRPVISTYVAGIPELVQPGVSGWLIPAGSVDALVEAMRSALSAPIDTLERMGLIGAAQVAAQHNADTEANKLIEIIAESLPSGRLRQVQASVAEIHS